MDRINSANVSVVSGKRYFQDLNLAANQRGTQVNALFLNNAQEELMYLIEQAGLTPNAANTTQVLAALRIFFGGPGSAASPGYMPLPGGIILQWGRATVPSSGGTVGGIGVTFPETFPNAVWGVLATALGPANSTSGGFPSASAVSLTVNGFALGTDTLGYTNMNQAVPVFWAALGK